eukprot:Phypoly_transcript_15227.p1 GENE.Phypoly_transcript_15227~~Phypoly_transcript_15227.p1  ORF type:complete len:266 (+),score=31.35 Phypoly_transcript_15227:85-882(+)
MKGSTIKVVGNYRIGKALVSGSLDYVRVGVNITSGKLYAIKSRKCDGPKKEALRREVETLSKLDHPNIVRLYDIVEDESNPKKMYLVLEFVQGVWLCDLIAVHGLLTEKEVRKLFRQIISAAEFYHSRLKIHRDLSPKNMLIEDGNIKICDFRFLDIIVPEERFSDISYVAPEVIKNINHVGPESDIWSMGVILYTLVCGRHPWPATPDGSPIITNILDGDYDTVPLTGLSAACIDLINIILVPLPSKRATLDQIRNHPWVNEGQ